MKGMYSRWAWFYVILTEKKPNILKMLKLGLLQYKSSFFVYNEKFKN